MVFGFFSRKRDSLNTTEPGSQPGSPDARPLPPAESPDREKDVHDATTPELQTRSSSPNSSKQGSDHCFSGETEDAGVVPVPEPPLTPSPPLLDDGSSSAATVAAAKQHANHLRELIQSIPPQTLHAYTLSQLSHISSSTSFSSPTSPETILANVSTFFSELAPPPRLHCVRCHKSFFDVENNDRSCLVAHDDDSAVVERVNVQGMPAAYETLWGCCGRTVEGDGDMGPPDGWCYEGKHTTDSKRARFRADSTLHDDKLVSCDVMRCNGVPRRTLKRRGRDLDAQNCTANDEDGEDSADSVTALSASPSAQGTGNTRIRPTKRPRTQTKVIEMDCLNEHHQPTKTSLQLQEPMAVDSVGVNACPALQLPSMTVSPQKPRSKRKSTTPDPKPRSRSQGKHVKSTSPEVPKTNSPLLLQLQPSFTSRSVSPGSKLKPEVVIVQKPHSGTGSRTATATPLKQKSTCATTASSNTKVAPQKDTPTKKLRPRKSNETKGVSVTSTPIKGSSPLQQPSSALRRSSRTKALAEVVESSVAAERLDART